jgi:hypothetical protein
MKGPLLTGLTLVVLALSGPTLHVQTPATGRVMREKLTHMQGVLESLMVSNAAVLRRESESLARATELPGWSVLKSPEYLRHSAAFTRETEGLIQAARQSDLDAAAVQYMAVTMTCYQCHRYLKGARLAERAPSLDRK